MESPFLESAQYRIIKTTTDESNSYTAVSGLCRDDDRMITVMRAYRCMRKLTLDIFNIFKYLTLLGLLSWTVVIRYPTPFCT